MEASYVIDSTARGQAAVRLGEAWCRRQEGALEDVLATYGPLLQATAYLILGNAADAEEIALDALAQGWRSAHTLKDPGALRSWLLRIATRQALSRRRKSSWAYAGFAFDRMPSTPDTSERVALLDALAELPPRARACVVLHYWVGLPVGEVAAVLGRSPNTVKTHLKAGLRQLRLVLGDSVIDEGSRR